MPTTSLQPKPDPETKTGTSAINTGRRSNRAGFSSSTNLKIKPQTSLIYC